jgi:hypothetical protein
MLDFIETKRKKWKTGRNIRILHSVLLSPARRNYDFDENAKDWPAGAQTPYPTPERPPRESVQSPAWG